MSLVDMMAASARLGEAVVDPAAWLRVIEDICRAVGATGAVGLPQRQQASRAGPLQPVTVAASQCQPGTTTGRGGGGPPLSPHTVAGQPSRFA